MIPSLQLLFPLILCTLLGCNRSEKPASSAKSHRAILYFDGERRFQMDYEGTGYRQSSLQRGDSVEFKAMHLEHGADKEIHHEKWVDASFEGTVTTSGDEDREVRINLKVDNKVPFEIQTMGVTPEGVDQSSEPIPHHFSPGHHELVIEGKMTELFEKE